MCNYNDGCTKCGFNRVNDLTVGEEHKCICSEGSVNHELELNTFYCTTNTDGVVSASFSGDYLKIVV